MADSSAAVGLLGSVFPLSTDKRFMLCRGTRKNLNTSENMSRLVSTKVLCLKVHAQAPLKTNPTVPQKKISKLSPIRNNIINIIKTVFSEAEKLQTSFNWNLKKIDTTVDPFQGKLVSGGLVFRQNFPIRSYQIDSNGKASIWAIMNILQDAALNHSRAMGLLADGFGSSPEMAKRNLIWVIFKTHIVVDNYPSWGDVVQVDKWNCASGKNSWDNDWLLCDAKTGKALVRASSVFVMMNKETRKLSKFIKEAREEIQPHLRNCDPIINKDGRKLQGYDEMVNRADNIRTGLTPGLDNLDVNNHVNNAKYFAWILESAPRSILESYELSSVTLEYRKECGIDSVVQSLTTVVGNNDGHSTNANGEEIEMQHLLRLETGQEVARGRTTWKPRRGSPKLSNTLGIFASTK